MHRYQCRCEWVFLHVCACVCIQSNEKVSYLCGKTRLSSHTHTHRKLDSYYTARPNQWLLFTAWLPDFQNSFYWSFSSNTKNLVPMIRCSRIWSSTQDHAVLDLLLNMVDLFISAWSIWSGRIFLYQLGTSSERAHVRGWHLIIFTWFIGSGGSHTETHAETNIR